MIMNKQSVLTKKFLHSVSKHISNCSRLKGTEVYVVLCQDDRRVPINHDMVTQDFETTCRMYPYAECYIDTHHRTSANKQSILNHCLTQHFFDDLVDYVDDYNVVHLKSSMIVPGTYKFSYRYNKKSGRHWIRIR